MGLFYGLREQRRSIVPTVTLTPLASASAAALSIALAAIGVLPSIFGLPAIGPLPTIIVLMRHTLHLLCKYRALTL